MNEAAAMLAGVAAHVALFVWVAWLTRGKATR
jgi:hypothetical protein